MVIEEIVLAKMIMNVAGMTMMLSMTASSDYDSPGVPLHAAAAHHLPAVSTALDKGFWPKLLPKPPKLGNTMAQNPSKKAMILHTLGVQVPITWLQGANYAGAYAPTSSTES